MGNQEYQLKKPAVQCPYCDRWFKHQGYFIRHDRDSIVSCATKIRIAENDKIIKERMKKIKQKIMKKIMERKQKIIK